MLTAIVAYRGNEREFLEVVNLFFKKNQLTTTPGKIEYFPQLIVLDQTGEMLRSNEVSELLRNYENSFVYVDASVVNFAKASNAAIEKALGEYILFFNVGDVFSMSALKIMVEFFDGNKERFDFLFPNVVCYSRDLKKYTPHFPAAATATINVLNQPLLTPVVFSGVLIKKEVFKDHSFDEELSHDYGISLIYRLLKINPSFALVKGANFRTEYSLESDNSSSIYALDRDWYWRSVQGFLLPLINSYLINDEKVPEYIQYLALYQLKWRFRFNANNATKRVVDDDVGAFFKQCAGILSHVENGVLLNKSRTFSLPLSLKDVFLRLKCHHKDPEVGYRPRYVSYWGDAYLEHEGNFVFNIENIKLLLEVLDFENDNLIIEGSLENFADFSKCTLLVFFDGVSLEVDETYRYAHTKFFGKSVSKRYTFRVKIPKTKLSEFLKVISFEIDVGGHRVKPIIITKRYTSRLSSKFRGSYWISNGYLIRFSNNMKSIKINKASLFNSIKAECQHLRGMLSAGSGSVEMLKLRCAYWLAYPFFKNKNIWLTYDKLYKAGDCGEYFYKYALTRNGGVIPAYLINSDAEDFSRLRKEGYKPLVRGTLKQRLYFLYAKIVLTTHTGVHNFNSFTDQNIHFLQNLLRFDVACIQHGLSVQHLAFDCNRLHNNIKRYYCASKYEVENLSHPIYGYEDKSALRLTGIPRYDGLKNKDKKQIVIAPTWRNYIAMPPVMGSARPYNPNFKDTDYFKIYNKLISDELFVNTAKRFGYKIIYLLHPITSVQVNDYKVIDGVEVVSALDVNYEKVLTESSLMVTDYSGVQFDFAYMRKPVVYYHPEELPPHYKEGGFFYDTMGFGEVCTRHSDLVSVICKYLHEECAAKQSYVDRQNDFFAHNDLNSCERIYDDMLEYQQGRR